MNKNFEAWDLNDLQKELQTDFKAGLTNEEGQQRLIKNGKNEFPRKKPRPWYLLILYGIFEPLNIVLMVAAVISVIAPQIGKWNTQPITIKNFIDFIVIMLIIVSDVILGTIQALKTRKSIKALEKLSEPTAVVVRDGIQTEILTIDLVIGDIVVLESGKIIPADLRFLETSDCHIDESIITGESIAVEKKSTKQKKSTILAEKKNIGFMSTIINSGRALGVVIATGVNTEIGKIGHSLQNNTKEETQLERKLKYFSYIVTFAAIVVAILMFLSLYLSGSSAEWSEHLIIAITLAIGIIPESLPVIVSIALSLSAKRMAKENVIVKKLASVETLGQVNVICTDKTGTLTQNKMTVKKVIINNSIMNDEEFKLIANDSWQKKLFLSALILNNDSVIEADKKFGDPTELALIDIARLNGLNEKIERNNCPRIDEIPFDSKRKLMTTVNKINQEQIIFTKGAVDQLIKISTQIMIGDKIKPFTTLLKNEILKKTIRESENALRILGFAYRLKKDSKDMKYEKDLIFLGAVGMIDPVRTEAIETIEQAQAAGIKVVMITGDHIATALAIAKDLNLAHNEDEIMNSEILDKKTDKELIQMIDSIRVFARVNPNHKTRIVSLLQQKGNIVSMTGDGVNDAPSLAKADIGIAMGITGTDVAKDAADVVLTDDYFQTILKGIDEGRNIYQKIRQVIVLLMGFNLGNVINIFLISLISHIAPLEAVNILYFALIVETCLAIAMAMGPVDITLMKMKPFKGNFSLFKGLLSQIIKIGVISSFFSILSFYIGWWSAPNSPAGILRGRTFIFVTTIFIPIFLVHFIKLSNWKASSKIHFTVNKYLIYSSIIAVCLNLIAIFTPVINHDVFWLMGYGDEGWNYSNWWYFFVCVGLATLPTFILLIINGLTFFSYHYIPSSWMRNRRMIQVMVENDHSEMEKKRKKEKNPGN